MSDPVELSVVIPAYNEQARLADTVAATIRHLRDQGERFEIIVSDDGSTDDTVALAMDLIAEYPEVRLVRTEVNRGKGHAVKVGMQAATGRQVLFADADGATPAAELDRLVDALDAGADIAVGSRALDGHGVQRETRLHRRLMGRVFAAIVSRRLAPGVEDTQCGFKLFTAAAAQAVSSHLTIDGFAFDLEIFVIARHHGLAVTEVPVNWSDAPGSKVHLLSDSLRMMRDARRIRRRADAGYYRL